MRRLAQLLLATNLVLAGSAALAGQDSAPSRAPDGRAPQLRSPLYFSPKPNAPFTAIARTISVQTLPDGSTVSHENARRVMRDAEGRIFQERVTFVPVPNDGSHKSRVHAVDYQDPVEHTWYHCDTASMVCNLFEYHAPANDAVARAGLQSDRTTFLNREDLGVDTFAGLDVQRTRETTTLYRESNGNTRTILRSVDYWYSPALGVNVQVKRHDPRDGDQTLWLTDVSLAAPDPENFKVPAGYRIVDHRDPAAAQDQ